MSWDMPRNTKPPPPPPKGTRHPGAGRKKGQPNRISVEVRQLVGELVTNVQYQAKLRRDFQARKVHPTIESLVWTYHLGKPTQPIAVSGSMAIDVNARIEEERRIFATLDIADLEQLAAESQALVNRAVELSKIAGNREEIPQDVVVEAETTKDPSELLGNTAESYKHHSVNQPTIHDADPINPHETEG
jgi:hypothetical protein